MAPHRVAVLIDPGVLLCQQLWCVREAPIGRDQGGRVAVLMERAGWVLPLGAACLRQPTGLDGPCGLALAAQGGCQTCVWPARRASALAGCKGVREQVWRGQAVPQAAVRGGAGAGVVVRASSCVRAMSWLLLAGASLLNAIPWCPFCGVGGAAHPQVPAAGFHGQQRGSRGSSIGQQHCGLGRGASRGGPITSSSQSQPLRESGRGDRAVHPGCCGHGTAADYADHAFCRPTFRVRMQQGAGLPHRCMPLLFGPYQC